MKSISNYYNNIGEVKSSHLSRTGESVAPWQRLGLGTRRSRVRVQLAATCVSPTDLPGVSIMSDWVCIKERYLLIHCVAALKIV